MITPGQREIIDQLTKRVAIARTIYLEALKFNARYSRTALEALCFYNSEKSELDGYIEQLSLKRNI